jgi:hypothetical protein
MFLSMSDWQNAVSEHPESKIGLVKLLKFGKLNELADASVQEVSSLGCILQILEKLLSLTTVLPPCRHILYLTQSEVSPSTFVPFASLRGASLLAETMAGVNGAFTMELSTILLYSAPRWLPYSHLKQYFD